MHIIEKDKKGNYTVSTISPVNGKVLTKSRNLTQKISVWTNIQSTMAEYNGNWAVVEDHSVSPVKRYEITDKGRKEVSE